MKRVGQVTGVKDDMLQITFCRPADCGKCHACIGGKPTTVLKLKGKAQVGDHAVVDMPNATVMKASMLAYILPLIGLVGGAALGSLIAPGDAATGIGGFAGLLIALGAVFVGEKTRRNDARWAPVLCEIWPKDTMPQELKEE